MDKASIVNMAMGHLGRSVQIENLDTETNLHATQGRLWYDVARKSALATYDWSFARKRRDLAVHSQDPSDEWLYRYKKPDDCIAPRRIPDPFDANISQPFQMEVSDAGDEETIQTNAEDAVLIYTFDQTRVDLFSMNFILVLSYFLAHYTAMAVTGDKDLKERMLRQALAMSKQGGAIDGNTQGPSDPPDAPIIAARQ